MGDPIVAFPLPDLPSQANAVMPFVSIVFVVMLLVIVVVLLVICDSCLDHLLGQTTFVRPNPNGCEYPDKQEVSRASVAHHQRPFHRQPTTAMRM